MHVQTKQLMEADLNMRAILEAAHVLKTSKGPVSFTGPAIGLGDFCIRLGRPNQRAGDDVLGTTILVDVEYMPLNAWELAQPVLAVSGIC